MALADQAESGVPYVLVDTNVFVYLTRGRQQAARFAEYVENRRIVLSFATVAELRRGAFARGYNEDSWQRMEADIANTAVVTPDDALSREWAQLTDEARKMGHALGAPAQAHDAWVAATARLYKLPLVTEDGDFDGFPDLQLLPAREPGGS